MVEAVTGRKLGQVMHDDLFAPLGMDSTAFRITVGDARASGRASITARPMAAWSPT